MHLFWARSVLASNLWTISSVWWWIFVLSVRLFVPYNIKPLRLFGTQVPCLWSIASSQDSEWSTDWTTSGIWMLNNYPLNRVDSWIIHQPAECPISFGLLRAMLLHLDLSSEQKVREQILGTPTTSIRQSCLPRLWETGRNKIVETDREASKGCKCIEEMGVNFQQWAFWLG